MVSTRPYLSIYVVWHPSFAFGAEIAESIYKHYKRDIYQNAAGTSGIDVFYRSAASEESVLPSPIDFEAAETTAVVALVDPFLSESDEWREYVSVFSRETDRLGLRARLYPVAITQEALHSAGLDEQAIRWDHWSDEGDDRVQHLISDLTYELCRLLRNHLQPEQPQSDAERLESYLRPVRVFLSHSKRDADGERIAKLIRDHIHSRQNLDSFFDVRDIPAGFSFSQILLHNVATSAVIAIHTDTFSSREWCRKEILEAKLKAVPLVVANCLARLDERGFPYLGNVPIARMDPAAVDRIQFVIGLLLDEVLKDLLWRCRVRALPGRLRRAVFLSRQPELISLAAAAALTPRRKLLLVYPDPPLGTEEERLFEVIAPHVRLRSMTEWLAEAM